MTINNNHTGDTPIYDKVANGDVEGVENNVSSAVPKGKVVAATVGAGVGSALANIIVWWVELAANIDIPNEVSLSIGIVITAGLSFAGGYFKKD